MSLKNAFGATMLIVGTSVGAAVLALPIATAELGFLGTTLTYLICWFFMTIGALCVLEANLSSGFGTNMVSMSAQHLGATGKWVTWITYLILLYALTASYLTGASGWIMQLFGYFKVAMSAHSAAIIAAIIVMGIIFCGTHFTDLVNRILMVGLLAVFVMLTFVSIPHLEPQLLFATKGLKPQPLPLIITAFGYAIIVPTLANYLHGNNKQLYRIILWGSLIPLIIYLIWELLIVGILPLKGDISLNTIAASSNPVVSLPQQLELKLNQTNITLGMSYFSIFALFTSILGVCLSLFDFLADGLKLKKNVLGKAGLALLTFLPPLAFVYFFPQGFTFALSFAGIFVSILLGILPALMVWKITNRTAEKPSLGWVANKPLLALVIAFFGFVIMIECHNLYAQFN